MVSHAAARSAARKPAGAALRQNRPSPLLVCLLFCWTTVVCVSATHAQSDEYDRLIFDPVPLSGEPNGEKPGDVSGDISGNDASAGSEPVAAADLRTLDQLQLAVEESLAESDLYSPLLRERYLDLARLQQRIGQHEAAMRTLDAAMHITRVNEGLFTASQIVDLELMIESAQALGETEREAELRGYLYYVQQKAYAPGDPRMLAAMEDWADWNLQAYQQSVSANPFSVMLAGGNRAEELVVVHNTTTGDARFIPRRHTMSTSQLFATSAMESPYALSPEMVTDERLRAATDIFEDLLEVARETDSPEHVGLATRRLASAGYALKWQMNRMLDSNNSSFSAPVGFGSRRDLPVVTRGYGESEDAFEEYIELLRADPDTAPETLARAWTDLGDFQLAYGEEREALEAWRKAISHLQEAGLDEDAIHAALNPTPPLPVPGFAVHPYQRALFGIAPDDTLEYQGYIDVSMDIFRDGSTRNVTIIQASEDTPQRIRTRLIDHLRTQKFRPLVGPDDLSGIDDLQTRYYYSY